MSNFSLLRNIKNVGRIVSILGGVLYKCALSLLDAGNNSCGHHNQSAPKKTKEYFGRSKGWIA